MLKTRLLPIAGFIALVAYLRLWQPYEIYMEQAEPWQLALYHGARVIFFIYFLLIVFGLGMAALRTIDRTRALTLSPLDTSILAMLAGLAILRPLLLVLGLAYLYRLWVLLPLALFGLWAGLPHVVELMRRSLANAKQAVLSQPAAETALTAAMAALALAAIGLVLGSKLFFPLADPDYLDHYLNYYVRVVEDGHLWPGAAWHHFYDAKGGAEIFLAVGLGDALSPFAVGGAMFTLALAITASLARRISGESLGALAAIAMAAVALSPVVPGVAEFCKQHIIGGALLLGMAWISRHSLAAATAQEQRSWRILLCLHMLAIALFRPTFAAIASAYALLMLCYALIIKQRAAAKTHALAALASIAGVGLLLGFNYFTTGLADATPYRLFYHLADQERLAQWFSPFWLLVWDLGSSLRHGSIAWPDLARLMDTARILRLSELGQYALLGWAPLLLAVAASMVVLRRAPPGLVCILALLAAAGAASLFIRQDISLVRAYIFCAFAVALLGAIPFGLARQAFATRPLLRQLTGLVLAIITALAVWQSFTATPNRHLRDIARLATGRLPMAELYARDYPRWRDYASACRAVPEGKSVWTSRYMPTPGCRAENFFYFTMGHDWHGVLFEPPEVAAAALQKSGLDYFLIDSNDPFFDLLPYAPLFAPANIAQHLGVAWAQNGVWLLTWKTPATAPLPPEFFPAYEASVRKALVAADFPAIYREMADIYRQWKTAQRWPVAVNPALPRPRGWQ